VWLWTGTADPLVVVITNDVAAVKPLRAKAQLY
jgi:hypothetical protein